jgi:hypothetical protein
VIGSLRAQRVNRQGQRDKAVWEAAACWYRVRYSDGTALQRVLAYLSNSVGPLALRRRCTATVTTLTIGIAAERATSLESRQPQGFLLQPVPIVPEQERLALYTPADCLPARDCDAWVVDGGLFVAVEAGIPDGASFPKKVDSAEFAAWRLTEPELGEVLDPVWPGNPPLPEFEVEAFNVGYAGAGRQPVSLPGCQIVGDSKRMGLWLEQFAAANPGMDVIDCSGQLAPRLVANYDAFTVSLHQPQRLGFNPLAALATADLTRQRNAWWWQGLHLPPPCLAWIRAHATLASLGELLRLAQASGVVGQLLQSVLQAHLAADELRLLQNDVQPWEQQARVLAYLPGKTAGVRHIARALAANLLLSGRSVLLIQPLFTGSDWRFLLPHKLAAVTGQTLSLPATILLRPRVAQLDRLRALVPDTACEYLLGLAADEAFIAQQEAIWRVSW